MNHALDACAMIADLRGEAGGSVVDNLLEVYYNFIRKHSEPTARQALDDLAAAGVIERRTMSKGFTRRVGQLKARGGIAAA